MTHMEKSKIKLSIQFTQNIETIPNFNGLQDQNVIPLHWSQRSASTPVHRAFLHLKFNCQICHWSNMSLLGGGAKTTKLSKRNSGIKIDVHSLPADNNALSLDRIMYNK